MIARKVPHRNQTPATDIGLHIRIKLYNAITEVTLNSVERQIEIKLGLWGFFSLLTGIHTARRYYVGFYGRIISNSPVISMKSQDVPDCAIVAQLF